jgi:hypothetical protein
MDNDSLRAHLAKLHSQMSDALRADPKSQEALHAMMQDINRLIDKPPDPAATAHASLADRLERVAVQFEVAHPTLAASTRRLVDLLGEVGI